MSAVLPNPFTLRGLILLTFSLVVTPLTARAAEKPPNILFIFADDWGRFAGMYAGTKPGSAPAGALNELVRTPNLDRIAKQGVLFRNAHVNSPSCTPCRSSLLSGQYFWRTGRGAILRGAVWDPAIPSYPLMLRDGGYHIGKSLKVWSPGKPVDAPFEGRKHAFEKAGTRMNHFSDSVTKLAANGMPPEVAKQEIYREVRGNFRQFIAAREAGKPFHYWFGPTNTHRNWVKGSGRKLWQVDPDRLKGKLPAYLPDVPEVREDLADYLGEVMALDGAIGALMEELRSTGEFDNTLIAISGDHGPPGFPAGKCNLYTFGTGVSLVIAGPGVKGGRIVEDFTCLTDLAPTFLEAAGVPVPKVVTGRSLWPVLKSEKSGQVDPERTWVVTGRERHVDVAREGSLPYPQRAIHTSSHLYIINYKPDRYPLGDPGPLLASGKSIPAKRLINNTRAAFPDMDGSPTKAWLIGQRDQPEWKATFDRAFGLRPREELYDLAADPDQLHNLAAEPASAKIRAGLETRLLAELKLTEDPRVLSDEPVFEKPPFTSLEAPE